jgi:hypothetical protein
MLTSPLAWAVYGLWILTLLVAGIGWSTMRKAAIAARRKQIEAEYNSQQPPEVQGYI